MKTNVKAPIFFCYKYRLLQQVLLLLFISTSLYGFDLGFLDESDIDINGYGWFGDLQLEKTLEIIDVDKTKKTPYSTVYVEDAAWILAGSLRDDGYLYPKFTFTLYRDNKVILRAKWDEGFDPELPMGLLADSIDVDVTQGIFFYFDSIDIANMPEEPPTTSFFYESKQLFITKGDRYYNESRKATGFRNIKNYFRDLGYNDVEIIDPSITINKESGAVQLKAKVQPGNPYFVQKVSAYLLSYAPEDRQKKQPQLELIGSQEYHDQAYSPIWKIQASQRIRARYLAQGYPEARVETRIQTYSPTHDRVDVDINFIIIKGPKIRIGKIEYQGAEGFPRSLLEEQVQLKSGELLSLSEAQKARNRISKLNIFKEVDTHYVKNKNGIWDIVYTLEEKKTTELSLIFGVGSYEILRGGFEVIERNLWNRAHHNKITAIKSFRTSEIDYIYSIPQIFATNLEFFAEAQYLYMEQLSFDREEYGISGGYNYYWKEANLNLVAQYNYQLQNAKNLQFSSDIARQKAFVSSLEFRASKSELNNILYPTDGYSLFSNFEFAFTQLGGQVEFQSIEIGGAWHHPIANGLSFHIGLRHGVVTTLGNPDTQIPVNNRFFMGGENTVRGYRQFQAAPVDSNGNQIGAVSFVLLQVELVQNLFDWLSVVAFVDAVGNAAYIENYPFNKILASAGGGISINTVVGPLRLEYGQNIDPRPGDPSGTFQVAIGFPF